MDVELPVDVVLEELFVQAFALHRVDLFLNLILQGEHRVAAFGRSEFLQPLGVVIVVHRQHIKPMPLGGKDRLEGPHQGNLIGIGAPHVSMGLAGTPAGEEDGALDCVEAGVDAGVAPVGHHHFRDLLMHGDFGRGIQNNRHRLAAGECTHTIGALLQTQFIEDAVNLGQVELAVDHGDGIHVIIPVGR